MPVPNLRKNSLAVVLGPTASGKTALAVELALALGGEVVSADSMQIYRGMDIGTAKPTEQEMRGVPHHLIGILDPGEQFSVADYANRARKVIDEIISRGKLPILAGGTGLYIQAIVDNIHFSEEAESDPALRNRLKELAEKNGNEAVWEQLLRLDPETAKSLHPNNLGRVIRAIEVYTVTGKPISEQVNESRKEPCPYQVCQIGLRYIDREKLYGRINERVRLMMQDGLLEEAKRLREESLAGTAGQAIGYKEFNEYFSGDCSLEDAIQRLQQGTRHYAKRQLTWFGRDERIHWVSPDALPEGETVLSLAQRYIEDDCGV